ncbi:MAG: SufS family cysteine desulfurase [Alphaproteobacteria bacterium]|nr:SufS family cysteine desulfurase [Alphaproteobacteria bacterium]
MARFDPAAIRAQFPILATGPDGKRVHYLDNAASAQMPQAVLDAVIRFETTQRANVHRGVHRLAEAATNAYDGARAAVARYLGVTPDGIVFTSGTTAAINTVAHALGETLSAGDEIVISELEHHGNIVPWQMLAQRRGLVLRALPVTAEGTIDLTALDRVVTKKCRLIALAHASNVTGAVLDPAPVAAAARAMGARVLLDGAQRIPHGPLDLLALGCDFYAFSGHKMFAPHGIGVLWGRPDLLAALPPFLGGGGMIEQVTLERTTYATPPRRFEAGTPPIGAAIGLAAAVDWIAGLDWQAATEHEKRLTGRILDGLSAITGAHVIGPTGLQGRLGVVSVVLDGAHPHDVSQILDTHNVACRGGHHCAQPLHARFGVNGSTRASLAPYNGDDDVDAFLAGLADAAARLR